ncbi:bacterio-opsin activator domain-containing protein [Natrialbaceae archaeon GCM10025810]|uniref:bacterio-opsin activator domain-containing protein n=1 Tax=Halovalidus salilacus TaxID=3075124 RepID=UPI0036146165
MATTGNVDVERVLVVGPDRARVESVARDLQSVAGPNGTVSTATTVESTLERLEAATVDCVCVCPDGGRGGGKRNVRGSEAIPDGDGAVEFGLETVEAIRERDGEAAVVFYPENGSEALASAAVAAGAAEYVCDDADLASAVERAVGTARTRRERRERTRQFRAIADDPDAYVWTLAPDGTVRRANGTALEGLDATEGEVRGRPFWALPWRPAGGEGGHGSETEAEAEPLEATIERAADGAVVRRELRIGTGSRDGDDPRTLEVTVRPVRDESGAIVSLLAEGADVTDRVELERELRESEELHRVTLNNMTDTILITDDEGAFTYVCPNVHFIFGYSDDEIRDLGTIDEVLGEDLFDPDELESEGVLTNIECTATDKRGREHVLLVNVRRVDIQGGTTLYSCRDVTTRKRREEALSALHRTARRVLYAETDREIAEIVVEDAVDVLGLEANAVFLFDTDENVLEPAACAPALERLDGPQRRRRASADTLVGSAFVAGESRFFDDVRDSPLSDDGTDLRSAAVVPLRDHGVLVAGSDEVGAFDEVTEEVTDLLAATAEAALDRVERETTLREQERELTERNRELTRLDRINEIIREIDQALVRAETREEIERAVCDRLTADDRFRFAWIGVPDAGGAHLRSRAHGGAEGGYLDGVSFALEDDALESEGSTGPRAADLEPAVRTAAFREVTVVSNVANRLHEDEWRREALSRDYQSAISVPLAYDEFAYGVLTVYADRPEAFDAVSRAVLEELGETVASAIAAVERKSALLTPSSTRIEFAADDETFLFQRLAARGDCAVSFDGGVTQRADGVSVVARVDGAPVEDVAAAAEDLVSVADARVIGEREGEESGTLLLELTGSFLALRLADHGVVLRGVEATPSGSTVVVDVPSAVDVRRSIEVVSSVVSDVDLVSKRTVERATARDLRSELLDRLTERQLEVVRLAYYGGFFESPRERTGEEIAETLGISPAAFYRHNRTVQRKLFSILFDELDLPANVATGGE